mmetsp:Transcript_6383/g.10813  ORF Transcript_6383/g.10813 Transcript_6383/m.10813 type:complete len:285 (-) Transcript_6383:269-1123(-)
MASQDLFQAISNCSMLRCNSARLCRQLASQLESPSCRTAVSCCSESFSDSVASCFARCALEMIPKTLASSLRLPAERTASSTFAASSRPSSVRFNSVYASTTRSRAETSHLPMPSSLNMSIASSAAARTFSQSSSIFIHLAIVIISCACDLGTSICSRMEYAFLELLAASQTLPDFPSTRERLWSALASRNFSSKVWKVLTAAAAHVFASLRASFWRYTVLSASWQHPSIFWSSTSRKSANASMPVCKATSRCVSANCLLPARSALISVRDKSIAASPQTQLSS